MASGASTTRMDPTREGGLVARARVDATAFGELYDWYLPRIHGYVIRRVGDRDLAEDLTATTFERALEAVRRPDFRNESFGGFLYRVAANAIVDHARRSRHTVPLGARASDFTSEFASDVHKDAGDGAGDDFGDDRATRALAAAVDRDTIRRALLRLSETHRQVIVMKFFDGLEVHEMCAILSCSRATFAVKLHRALAALREAMAEEATDAA